MCIFAATERQSFGADNKMPSAGAMDFVGLVPLLLLILAYFFFVLIFIISVALSHS